MVAYYNEIDPYAVEWLRELISRGLIPDGEVDSRSITEIEPVDLMPFTQCHFFAGIGVWAHALRTAGWADDRPVWTGSCPCQPFSGINQKGGGLDDDRHLWPYWFRLIQECAPATIFGEQVASKGGLTWLDVVQPDMEGAGYAFAPFDLCAAGFGAPHIRQRLYFAACRLGDAELERLERHGRDGGVGDEPRRDYPVPRGPSTETGIGAGPVAVPSEYREVEGEATFWQDCDWLLCNDGAARPIQPNTLPLDNGPAGFMDRGGAKIPRKETLHAIGNAIVGPVASALIESYMEVLDMNQ